MRWRLGHGHAIDEVVFNHNPLLPQRGFDTLNVSLRFSDSMKESRRRERGTVFSELLKREGEATAVCL